MPYITSVEEIGYDRGLNVGKTEGERSLVLRQLERKLSSLSDRTRSKIIALSVPQLDELGEALLDFSTIEDLTTWLDNH